MWCSTVGVIVTLTLSIIAAPLVTDARPATKVYRIGRLSPGRPSLSPIPMRRPSGRGCSSLVTSRGRISSWSTATQRGAQSSSPTWRPRSCGPVDVLVVGGTAAIRAAQHATRTIPIVMSGSYDPVQEGFVAGWPVPRGTSRAELLAGGLPGKRLELLKEAVPQSTRIAVLWNPVGPGYASRQSLLQNLTAAARALGLQLHVVEVRHADELETTFAALPRPVRTRSS